MHSSVRRTGHRLPSREHLTVSSSSICRRVRHEACAQEFWQWPSPGAGLVARISRRGGRLAWHRTGKPVAENVCEQRDRGVVGDDGRLPADPIRMAVQIELEPAHGSSTTEPRCPHLIEVDQLGATVAVGYLPGSQYARLDLKTPRVPLARECRDYPSPSTLATQHRLAARGRDEDDRVVEDQ